MAHSNKRIQLGKKIMEYFHPKFQLFIQQIEHRERICSAIVASCLFIYYLIDFYSQYHCEMSFCRQGIIECQLFEILNKIVSIRLSFLYPWISGDFTLIHIEAVQNTRAASTPRLQHTQPSLPLYIRKERMCFKHSSDV